MGHRQTTRGERTSVAGRRITLGVAIVHADVSPGSNSRVNQMLPVNQKIFDEWVGPPVDVKPIYNCKTLHESGGIAFELYKEACRVVAFAAHLLDDTAAAQGGFSRNQA